MSNLTEDGECFNCGKQTHSLSANPSEWGFFFPHIDGQGEHRYYHTKCLYPMLKDICYAKGKCDFCDEETKLIIGPYDNLICTQCTEAFIKGEIQ